MSMRRNRPVTVIEIKCFVHFFSLVWFENKFIWTLKFCHKGKPFVT